MVEELLERVAGGDRELHEVDLSCSSLTVSQLEDLAAAMEGNSSVHVLNLSENWVGSEGIRMVCAMMAENGSLGKVNLHGNAIGDSGMEHIVAALRPGSRGPAPTWSLDLSLNDIGANGIRVLCDVLLSGAAPLLTEVNLCENWIADDGAANLADLVKTRKSLLDVNVSGNKATASQLSSIEYALEQNRNHFREALASIKANRFSSDSIRAALDAGFPLMGTCPDITGNDTPTLHWMWENAMRNDDADIGALAVIISAVGPNVFDLADHQHRSIAAVTAQHFSLKKLDAITDFVDAHFGIPAIHLACERDWTSYVHELVARDPSQAHMRSADSGRTPLQVCMEKQSLDCAVELIGASDLSAVDFEGNTALHTACIHRCETVVPVLLHSKCPLDDLNKECQTALHIAVEMGMASTVQDLLDAGATMCQDGRGRTPLHKAATAPYSPMIDTLISACSPKLLDCPCELGRTALHAAVLAGNEQTTRTLLCAGANPSIADHKGKLPFDYATPLLHTLLLETRSPAPRLKSLLLRNRGLKTLPTSMAYWRSFKSLFALDVRDNLLRSLPTALLEAPKLSVVELSGNPFTKATKLQKGDDKSWKATLKSLTSSKAASSWKQAQVFVLGSKGSGKTSLMGYLGGGTAGVISGRDASGTQRHIVTQKTQSSDIRLNIMEICSDPAAIYCCESLMSGGGIFLITVDASKDNLFEELPVLEHWLRFVDSLSPSGCARAFIVVTHQDSITVKPELLESNKETLQRHFKKRIFASLECISFVGIQQGFGMKQLQSRLVKAALSICNALPMPIEWKLVAGAIRSTVTRPFLTFPQLVELAERHDVEERDLSEVISALQVLGYLFAEPELHALFRDCSIKPIPSHYFLLVDVEWFGILLSQVVPLKFTSSGKRSTRKEDAGIVNSSCLAQLQVLEPRLFPSADAPLHLQILEQFHVAIASKESLRNSASSSGASSVLLVPSLVPKKLDNSQKQRMDYLLAAATKSTEKHLKQRMCFELLPVPFAFIGSLFCKLYGLAGTSVLFHWRSGFMLDIRSPTAGKSKVLVELEVAEGRNLVNQLIVSTFGVHCALVLDAINEHCRQYCVSSVRRFDSCLHCLNDSSEKSGHQYYQEHHRFTEHEIKQGNTGLCRGVRPVSFSGGDSFLSSAPLQPQASLLREHDIVDAIERVRVMGNVSRSRLNLQEEAPVYELRGTSIDLTLADDALANPCKPLVEVETSISSIVRPSEGEASHNSLFLGCSDGSLRRYGVAPCAKEGVTLKNEDSWRAHSRAVREARWLGSRLVSISLDGKVRCWQAHGGDSHTLSWEAACLRENECICEINDEVFCTIAPSERCIRLWYLETGELVKLVDIPVPVGEPRAPHVTCITNYEEWLAVAAGRYLFLFNKEDFYCCGYWKLTSDSDRRTGIKLMATTPAPSSAAHQMLWVALGSNAVALAFTPADLESDPSASELDVECTVQYVVACGSPVQLLTGHATEVRLVVGMKNGALLSLALHPDGSHFTERLLLDEEKMEVPKHGLLFATSSEPPTMVLLLLTTECVKADKSIYNRIVATALA